MATTARIGNRKTWTVNVGAYNGGTHDHSKLFNRDADNQHPMGAIKGLETFAENTKDHMASKENPHEVTAEQVGARPDTWMPTASEVGARPDTWMPTAAEVGASPAGINAFEASGNSIDLSNSGDAPLLGLKVYGKTTQNGTPTPQSPVSMESVGDSGSVAVTAAGKNLLPNFVPHENLYVQVTPVFYLPSNSDFTISAKYSPVLGSNPNFYVVSKAGIVLFQTGFSSDLVHTFNTGDNTGFYFQINNGDGVLASATIGYLNSAVQLECGSVSTDFEPYNGKTLIMQTPNGLAGIPVPSGGNFTDENGQRWVCDEIDFVNGKRIMRTYEIEFDGVTVGKKMSDTDPQAAGSAKVYAYILPGHMPYPLKSNTSALCNYAKIANGLGTSTVISLNWSRDFLGLTSDETNTTVITNAFNTKLKEFSNAGNPLRVRYILVTPIETPLSAEELEQYAALHTHKPNTTIYNNGGANMDVRYCTPNTAVPMNFGRANSVLMTDEHGCVVAVPIQQLAETIATLIDK